jgi:hypothetical protein
MAAARWRLSFAGVLLFAALIGRADAPPSGEGKMPREADKAAPSDDSPPSVIISKKEYQDLLDKIARLEGTIKAESPSDCHITGQVTGEVAHLKIRFEFSTTQRKTRVALACGQGYPTRAEIDGHSPALRWSATDGHSVVVEDAGDHALVLEMDLPLAARERGAERGLDLDLPAAVVTSLDLELPSGVKKPSLHTTVKGETASGKPYFTTEAPSGGPTRVKARGLGPVERLELTWEASAPETGPAVLTVLSSHILANVSTQQVNTSATIKLGVRRGQLEEVKLFLPPQATVSAPPGSEDRIVRVEPPKGSAPTIVRLKASTDPLTLNIGVPPQRAEGPILIGPFLVVGAPQRGDILVTAPPQLSLSYQPRGETQYRLEQRYPSDAEKSEDNTLLALQYSTSTLPSVDKAAPPPFLELKTAPRTGVIQAHVSHTLRLDRQGGNSIWRLSSEVELGVVGPPLAQVQMQLPRDYQVDDLRIEGGERGAPDPQILGIILTPKRKDKERVKFTLVGHYDPAKVPAGDTGKDDVPFRFPMLLRPKADRGAHVLVELPSDLELLPRPGFLWEGVAAGAPNKRSATTERWPEEVVLAWQPYRPPLSVNGEVRIVLQGRQASVTHRLWLPPGSPVPEQLILSVPREVIGLTSDGKGEIPPNADGKDVRTVPLGPQADRDHPLILHYSFRLLERGNEGFAVPLVWPTKATAGETHVCLWSDPGTRPELAGGRWEARRTEEIKDEASYPSLVLVSREPGAALRLRLGDVAGTPLAAFRVEKVLIQATVQNGGQQTYRARFLLGQLAAATLDLDLPAPLFRPNANPDEVKVLFAGKGAVWKPADETGKTARVQVPGDLVGKSAVLEVSYTLPPGRAVLQTLLQPPQLRGDPGAAPVRWQVALPPSWVPFSPDPLGADYGWGRRGWLFALRPTVPTAEFESWFVGRDNSHPEDTRPYPDPAVAVWRSSPEPLRLSHVPEQPWLLVCSLTLLIVGLALAFLSLSRAVFWGTLSILGVAALLVGLFWPGVLGAILYGCQPGVLVLLPVLGVQWLMQRRYRRQVVFLPGFTRLKAGSSLTRGSSNRPRGEPSTVDASPAPAADPSSKKSSTDGAATAEK